MIRGPARSSAYALVVTFGTHTYNLQHVAQVTFCKQEVPHAFLGQNGIYQAYDYLLLIGAWHLDGGFQGREKQGHGDLGQLVAAILQEKKAQHQSRAPIHAI
jgi:hypothetical protein